MRSLSIVTILILMTSCANLTEKAKNLRKISSLSQAKGCVKVGRVNTSSESNSIGGNPFYNHSAEVKMYNMAAEYGDTIYIAKDQQNFTGVEYQAIVFRCI